MKYAILIILSLTLLGCTTFTGNLEKVRQACRGNVFEYDDGVTSFKCQSKD